MLEFQVLAKTTRRARATELHSSANCVVLKTSSSNRSNGCPCGKRSKVRAARLSWSREHYRCDTANVEIRKDPSFRRGSRTGRLFRRPAGARAIPGYQLRCQATVEIQSHDRHDTSREEGSPPCSPHLPHDNVNGPAVVHDLSTIWLRLARRREGLLCRYWSERSEGRFRHDVGIVGAKLIYPNETIQHGGATLRPRGQITHLHRFTSRNDPGYRGQLSLARTLSAVTGACAAIRRAVFLKWVDSTRSTCRLASMASILFATPKYRISRHLDAFCGTFPRGVRIAWVR